jgi:hypothetical protein
MTDTVTPSFSKRIREGAIIVNPMSYSRTKRETTGAGFQSGMNSPPPITVSWTASGCVTASNLAYYNPTLPNLAVSSAVQSAVAEAKLKAIANMDRSAIETGEDLFELHETLLLLKNPLAGIRNNLERIARAHKVGSKGKTALSLYNLLQDNWLQYRFAFGPLVRSLHSVLSQIVNPSTVVPKLRYVSHGRSSVEKSLTARPIGLSDNATFDYSSKFKGNYHATIVYEKQNPVADFNWRYGLRAKDFPKTFWNIVPLSFMVDRIFDCSSAITSAVNLSDPSLKIRDGSFTSREEFINSTRFVSASNPAWTFSIIGDVITDTTFNMNRSSYQPSFRDAVPTLQLGNLVKDLTSLTDLVTLVTSRVRR